MRGIADPDMVYDVDREALFLLRWHPVSRPSASTFCV